MTALTDDEALEVVGKLIEKCEQLAKDNWPLKRMWVTGTFAARTPPHPAISLLIETGPCPNRKQQALHERLKEGVEGQVSIHFHELDAVKKLVWRRRG